MKTFTFTEYIKIIVISLLMLWGFFLIKPFIGALSWGIILAVALYPLYKKASLMFGKKHKKKATTLFSIILLALLIVPTYSVVSSLFDSVSSTVTALQNNELKISPPSENVKEWPVVGDQVYTNWQSLSKNSKQYAIDHKDLLLEKGSLALKSFSGILGSVLSFIFSAIIALLFMSNAQSAYDSSSAFANKLAGGSKGSEMLLIARDTVRNVVKGILLVAITQALLCFIGFKMIGIPAAAIFAFLVMLAAIVQIPVTLVVLPTVFIAFSISDSSLAATVFSIYIIVISLIYNVLKPILLAKGLKTPMVLIIIGAFGGVLLHGIIGLFIGTVLVSVLHQMYVAWLSKEDDLILMD